MHPKMNLTSRLSSARSLISLQPCLPCVAILSYLPAYHHFLFQSKHTVCTGAQFTRHNGLLQGQSAQGAQQGKAQALSRTSALYNYDSVV